MVLQAQVVLPYNTNLPKDVATNTFHFSEGIGGAVGTAQAVSDRLVDFYNEGDGAADPIAAWISSVVSRTTDACRIKWFDLDDAKPRAPIYETTFTLEPFVTATSLPLECAICLSYGAVPVSGISPARRRGRLYIGPLASSAGGSSSGQIPRPPSDLIDALGYAASTLATGGAGDGTWVVWSRVSSTAAAVQGGFVDNDLDTQRRRGPSATARTFWVA